MSTGETVTLGDREYRLVPQRIGRIRHSIEQIVTVFGQTAEDAPELDEQLVEFFKVFIPDLDPKWKLLGYASAEAHEAGEYDAAADNSPTPPEIADAIETIFQIHGGQRLMRVLKGLVDPEALKRLISTELRRQQLIRLQGSSSSASDEDGATSTDSSTTDPTSNGNGDSPSPDSLPSSMPTPIAGAESSPSLAG